MKGSSEPRGVASLFPRLLAVSREAATAGLYEVAYHALTAALHMAEADQRLAEVELVDAEVAAQDASVEAIAPPHPLSEVNAQRRGTRRVYASLRQHVEAVRLRLAAQARIDELHANTDDG